MTIFFATKDPAEFKQVNDFEIGSVSAVANNCTTANVLNDRSLFFGELVSTNKHSLTMVGGADRRPIHYGVAQISFRNDERNIFKTQLDKALNKKEKSDYDGTSG